MTKKELLQRVSALRGKKTNAESLRLRLYEMKVRDRTIANPAVGIYKLR